MGGDTDHQNHDMQWELESFGDYVGFKHNHTKEWMYVNNPALGSDRKHVLTWGGRGHPKDCLSFRFQIESHDDFFSIKSLKHNKWIGAGSPKLDDDRRHVLCYMSGGDPRTDQDMRWT